MRRELTGFAPDLDPAADGVVVDCDGIVPTSQGLAAALSPQDAGLPALGSTVTGAFVAQLLDGTRRTFAAQSTRIDEAIGTTWTDRSAAGGYTGTNRWRFCTFGANVLATNKAQPIQQAAPAGAFAAISGAPQAAIIEAVAGFVMAANTQDGVNGDNPDRWWCSALFNQADWTPSVTTQCANGRLVDTPGSIRGLRAMGNDCIAYKQNSMYIGRYVGPPVIWSWTRVPGDVGCASHEAVVVANTLHYFVGQDDFYVFDGTVPKSIGAPIREWFFANLNGPFRSEIIGVADLARDLIYWYFHQGTSTTLNACVVYNIRTQRWGKFTLGVAAALQYDAAALTYDSLGGRFATYDSIPSVTYDSPFWLSGAPAPAVFGTDNKLYSLTGTPGASFIETHDVGSDTEVTHLARVTPRYLRKPTTAQAVNFFRDSARELKTQDATMSEARGRFDFRRAARWHSVRFNFTGPALVNGMDVDLAPDSLE